MKNQKWEIGPWKLKNPELVVKLGFIIDDYKREWLPRLWREAEREALERMPMFEARELFHEEVLTKNDMIYSFRYYTPESNRSKMEGNINEAAN